MNAQRKAVEAVAAALKARFPNLTVDETIKLAFDLVELVEGYLIRGGQGA